MEVDSIAVDVNKGDIMSLRDLQLDYEYRSGSRNLVDDFYVPCLTQSVQYLRAVGFFTSHGLALAAQGLAAFIAHDGQMRLVASPWLEPEDIEAFRRGYEAREDIVERAILRQFQEEMLDGVPALIRHRLACIAWLIAEGRLDIKVACPSRQLLISGPGIYHEKVGIFLDREGNIVAFTGSPNETVGGLVTNFESLDVYVSWDDPHGRASRKKDNFERLWGNATTGLTVLDFPAAAKRKLLRLRPSVRPTGDPESLMVPRQRCNIDIPSGIQLRPYQAEVSEAWMRNEGRGFLVVATGSGNKARKGPLE